MDSSISLGELVLVGGEHFLKLNHSASRRVFGRRCVRAGRSRIANAAHDPEA